MDDADQVDPADAESILRLGEGEDDDPGWTCAALVVVTPSLTRSCEQKATNAFITEPVPGLQVWYALCPEHAAVCRDD